MKKWVLGFLIFVGVLTMVALLRSFPINPNLNELDSNSNSLKDKSQFKGSVVQKNDTQSENQIVGPDNAITTSQIALHDNINDCWVVYNNKIYDVTSYIPRHPGGKSKILRNCGSTTSFEKEFTKQHKTKKVKLLMKVGTFIGDFDVVGKVN